MTPAQLAATARFMEVASVAESTPRPPTLYSLAGEYTALLDMLADGEVDENEADALLDSLADDIKTKGKGLAVVVQSLENLAELQRREAKRQAERARRNEAAADRLREYAMRQMDRLGIDRLEYGSHTLKVVQNPPSVTVVDASAVPAEYQRTTITIDVDKRGILADYKASGEIPAGVEIKRGRRLDLG